MPKKDLTAGMTGKKRWIAKGTIAVTAPSATANPTPGRRSRVLMFSQAWAGWSERSISRISYSRLHVGTVSARNSRYGGYQIVVGGTRCAAWFLLLPP